MSTKGVRTSVGVAIGASVGTWIEWYDFLIAATAAALAWPAIYFPREAPLAGVLFAFAIFFIGYFARPIASLVFGHYGDTLGRRKTLLWTLVCMGVGTVGTGLTPGYNQIGIFGAVLIVIFRLMQGFGVGGEMGPATTWVIEHVRTSKWRNFWGSWLSLGPGIGAGLSALAYTIVRSSMNTADFLSWGWRVPFIIGGAVIVAALLIRLFLSESPVFNEMVKRKMTERIPIARLMREHYKTVIIVIGAALFTTSTWTCVLSFSLSYLTIGVKTAPEFATFSVLVASIAGIFTTVFGGVLGDLIGRKRTLMIGAVLAIFYLFMYFPLFNTANVTLILLAQVGMAVVTMLGNPCYYSFIPEQFIPEYRTTGTGFSAQTGFTLGSLAPVIAVAIFTANGGNIASWPYIAGAVAIFPIISLIALFFTKETMRTGLPGLERSQT